MELKEYLTQSRNQRHELLKTAHGYLQKATSNEIKTSPIPGEKEDIYSGPNPQGLRQFESDVGYHLKKLFTPGINERSQQLGLVSNRTVDEGIQKVYSKNGRRRKAKQLVIIPKGYNPVYIKIPGRVRNTKNFSVSPEVSGDIVNKSFNKIQQEIKAFRKSFHENLLLPILTTSGTHEYRSKVYKY